MIPTCIDNFVNSRSSFALLENCIYTLHKISDHKPKDIVSLSGFTYSLEESEEFKDLERECYQFNSSFFEKKITEMLKQKIGNNGENKNVDNIFSKIQEEQIDKMVLYQAMRDYINILNLKNNENIINKTRTKTKKYNFKTQDINLPTLDDLKTISPLVKKLYQQPGLLFFGNNVYTLKKDKTKDNFLQFKKQRYNLEFKTTSQEFLEKYRKIILDHIDNESEKMNKNLYQKIRQSEEDNKKKMSEIQNINKSINTSNLGEMGYVKKGVFYHVYLNIPKFINKHENKYYLFEPTRVAMDIKLSQSDAIFVKKPYIPNEFMNYHHPFVFRTGSICLGDAAFKEGRLEDELDVHFNRVYNIQTQNVSERIAKSLNEAKQVIEDGYIGMGIKPVHTLNESNFKSELLNNGLNDNRALGIRQNRIFPEAVK